MHCNTFCFELWPRLCGERKKLDRISKNPCLPSIEFKSSVGNERDAIFFSVDSARPGSCTIIYFFGSIDWVGISSTLFTDLTRACCYLPVRVKREVTLLHCIGCTDSSSLVGTIQRDSSRHWLYLRERKAIGESLEDYIRPYQSELSLFYPECSFFSVDQETKVT